jgi:hypothetical protein
MPKLTWWFDELADAFGQEVIDEAQREAVQRREFYATEGGLTIGAKPPAPERVQTSDQCLATSALIKKHRMLRPFDE